MPTGTRIKEIRKQKGLTQKQLGELCGMYESQIRKYENGNANPKIETLQKIADALGVGVYEFLEDDLFDATDDDPEYERNIIDDKANSILQDKHLTKEEKKKKIKDLSTQVAIMMKTHSDRIDNTAKTMMHIYLDELNAEGKSKALEQVEMLTKIPEYRKDNGNNNNR